MSILKKCFPRLTKKDEQGIAMMVACGVVLAVIVGTYLWISSHQEKLDGNFCLLGAAAEKHIAVIVDKSEKWDNESIVGLKSFLQGIYQSIHLHERLTVMVITDVDGGTGKTVEARTLFNMCAPRSEGECNWAMMNCRRIAQKYRESFAAPLAQLSDTLAKPDEASYSPLLKTVAQTINDNRSPVLDIYFISDLMENGYKFRFDDRVPLASKVVAEYPINTNNAKVAVHALFVDRVRYDKVLKDGVQAVWRDYLNRQGVAFNLEHSVFVDKTVE